MSKATKCAHLTRGRKFTRGELGGRTEPAERVRRGPAGSRRFMPVHAGSRRRSTGGLTTCRQRDEQEPGTEQDGSAECDLVPTRAQPAAYASSTKSTQAPGSLGESPASPQGPAVGPGGPSFSVPPSRREVTLCVRASWGRALTVKDDSSRASGSGAGGRSRGGPGRGRLREGRPPLLWEGSAAETASSSWAP